MPKYKVHFENVVTVDIVVETEDVDKAKSKAKSMLSALDVDELNDLKRVSGFHLVDVNETDENVTNPN